MTEAYGLITSGLSVVATALAAFATWRAPQSAARLAEQLRRASDNVQERQKRKLAVFSVLLQERAEIYSEEAVKALNVIDFVFFDSRGVKEAWSELYRTFGLKPIPMHAINDRLRALLEAMAKDIGLDSEFRVDDFARIYDPTALAQDRMIKETQRQQLLAAIQSQGAASNASPAVTGPWPPRPV